MRRPTSWAGRPSPVRGSKLRRPPTKESCYHEVTAGRQSYFFLRRDNGSRMDQLTRREEDGASSALRAHRRSSCMTASSIRQAPRNGSSFTATPATGGATAHGIGCTSIPRPGSGCLTTARGCLPKRESPETDHQIEGDQVVCGRNDHLEICSGHRLLRERGRARFS